MNRLQRLHAAGGQFKFLTKHLDGTGLYRNARIAILVAIAMLERVWVSEGIKTGQVRSAKKPGRPALSAVKVADVSRLLEQGIVRFPKSSASCE